MPAMICPRAQTEARPWWSMIIGGAWQSKGVVEESFYYDVAHYLSAGVRRIELTRRAHLRGLCSALRDP